MFNDTKQEKMPKAKETAPDAVTAQTAANENHFNTPAKAEGSAGTVEGLTMHSMNDEKFIDGVFAEMDEKEESEGVELTSNYLDFSEWTAGEKRDYIFTRMGTFTKDTGDTIPAVHLMDRTKKTFISASTVLVKSLEKTEKLPCAVRIACNGKVKGKNGSYYDLRVFTF